MKKIVISSAALAVLAGCAGMMGPSEAELNARALEVMKASFKERGQAKLDRLNQDETQRLCSEYAGRTLPPSVVDRIQKENLATVKYPADGKLVGDWKSGERIAQSGQGFQYSDDPSRPAGANCYACHQLAPQELSYGTIGPSLYHFGKLRGYTDETRRYAWAKIYNAEAFNACSNMVKHDGTYSTVYAHLSRFAADIREGARVRQGDTIGNVGQTGWATGPHLHYELRVNGEPRNPMSVALPIAMPLSDADRADFAAAIAPLAGQLAVVRALPDVHLTAAD